MNQVPEEPPAALVEVEQPVRHRKSITKAPTEDQRSEALFIKTIAGDWPPEIQQLVLLTARAYGLNPLTKEVFAIKTKRGYQVVVGIHGLLKKAQQHVDYAGIRSASVYPGEAITIGSDGSVDHKYDPVKRIAAGLDRPVGAWAQIGRVNKTGQITWTTKFLRFGDYNNPQSDSWRQQPGHMIETRAKAFVAREAYADAIGSLYTKEELEDVDARVPSTYRKEPVPITGPEIIEEGPQEPRGDVYGPYLFKDTHRDAGSKPVPQAEAKDPTTVVPDRTCANCGAALIEYVARSGRTVRQCIYAYGELKKGNLKAAEDHTREFPNGKTNPAGDRKTEQAAG